MPEIGAESARREIAEDRGTTSLLDPEEMAGIEPPKLTYSPALEGLRSMLLFVVIFAHTQTFLIPGAHGFRMSAFGSLTMFFVLTGYLVTAIVMRNLERTNTLQYRPFMWRRVQRLGAPMLLFVVVQFATTMLTGGRLFEPRGTETLSEAASVVGLVTYTLNWAPTFNLNQRLDMVQMWSLGVDMQFYLAWPLILWLLFKWTSSTKKILIVLALLIVAAQLGRVVEYQVSMGNRLFPWDVYQRPENSFDPFFAGAALCILWKRQILPFGLFKKIWIPAAAVFVFGMLFVVVSSPVPYYGGYLVATICSFLIIGEALRPGTVIRRVFSTLPLRAIGRISFSMYIWHLYVFVWFNRWVTIELWSPVRVILAYAALFIVTYIAWYIAERPFMRLPPLRQPVPVET